MFIHVVLALVIILLVIIQKGKGASIGAAFGSGSAGSVFGPRGATTFLNKATYVIVFFFFVTSLSLSYLSTNREQEKSIIDSIEIPQEKPASTNNSVNTDKPIIQE